MKIRKREAEIKIYSTNTANAKQVTNLQIFKELK
jgi:hypothetical protein